MVLDDAGAPLRGASRLIAYTPGFYAPLCAAPITWCFLLVHLSEVLFTLRIPSGPLKP